MAAPRKQKQNKKARKVRRPRLPRVMSDLAARQRTYAQLLTEPDNGSVIPGGVYDGELGNFQRFITTVQVANGVSQTAGILAFFPATGNAISVANAASNAALTFSVSNTSMPGATFLTANAAKTRGIAAKIELVPSALSVTNIVGEVAAGITTLNSFVSGTTSVDDIFNVSKMYGPIQRRVYRSNWFPSGLDHTYSTYNTAPDEDRHAVFIAFRNWPATALLQVRITYVVEYTVRNGIGIPPTAALSKPVGHVEVVHKLQATEPHWHHSIASEVSHAATGIAKDVGSFARAAAREGLMSLGKSMFRSTVGAGALMVV